MNAAGAQTWRRTETTIGIYRYRDVTIDGSGQIWAATTDGRIRRLSPTDGTIQQTLGPFTFGAVTIAEINGIAYDAADGGFWLSGYVSSTAAVFKIDATGVFIGPGFGHPSANVTQAATAPLSGNYTLPRALYRDPYLLYERSVSGGGADRPQIARHIIDPDTVARTGIPGISTCLPRRTGWRAVGRAEHHCSVRSLRPGNPDSRGRTSHPALGSARQSRRPQASHSRSLTHSHSRRV